MGALDYTLVISAVIAGTFSLLNTCLAVWLARQVRTPSGDTLGKVAERTHDLAAVSIRTLHKLNGGKDAAPGDSAADTV